MYNNWPTKCPYVQWLAYRVPICIINHLPGAHASTRLFSYQDPIIPPFTYQVPSVELRSPWQSNYFFSFSYKLLRSINDTPSVCLSVCLSVRVAVRLFACLSVCLPVYLPVRASDTQTCNDNTVTTRGDSSVPNTVEDRCGRLIAELSSLLQERMKHTVQIAVLDWN